MSDTTRTDTTEVAEKKQEQVRNREADFTKGIFASSDSFTLAWQMAQALAGSTIVPSNFQKSPQNCLIAIEQANRLNMSPFLVMQSSMKHMFVKDFEVKLVEEFFRALSVEARANIHLRQIYGDETHHVCEGFFKSFARALRAAVKIDPAEKGVPSSKGLV